MVVVDYSVHDRFRRFDYDPDDEQTLQQSLDSDATVDVALENFCLRLRKAVSLLSRHTVGESVESHSNAIYLHVPSRRRR